MLRIEILARSQKSYWNTQNSHNFAAGSLRIVIQLSQGNITNASQQFVTFLKATRKEHEES